MEYDYIRWHKGNYTDSLCDNRHDFFSASNANQRGIHDVWPSSKIQFFYFESLPEKNIVPSAQEFVDKRFPSGSNIEDVTKELTAAGAECSNGMSNGERYYLCYYLVKRMSLIMIEWKIMIYLDKTETKINNISVNRGYTGPQKLKIRLKSVNKQQTGGMKMFGSVITKL